MFSQQQSIKTASRTATVVRIGLLTGLWMATLGAGTLCQAAKGTPPHRCTSEVLPPGNGEDLIVTGSDTGACKVIPSATPYNYGNVNIYGGGKLVFTFTPANKNEKIDFWAKSILVEKDGTLSAGTPDAPIGINGNGSVLTLHLYGPAQNTGTGKGDGGAGITCLSDTTNMCGVDPALWTSNCPDHDCTKPLPLSPSSCTKSDLKYGGVNDCFYPYMPLDYDDGKSGSPPMVGYFGYKVLAVSYGGTLQLFGKKGATYSSIPLKTSDSGTSWRRLNKSVKVGDTALVLDRAVGWLAGDQIVLTSTDYLPAHSEQLTVKSVSPTGTVTVTTGVLYPHNGSTYDLGSKSIPDGVGPDRDPNVTCSGSQTNCVETRAAVGLLSRSIRIVSEGDIFNKQFPDESTGYSFGGHTVFRQGFAAVQIQGVEFYQMGQGGRIMHYPVHFHVARQTPQPNGDFKGTFIKDSSVWDSMTRWMTIHASEGVTLARNVGYKSIGHGYYLEDGSETNNQLYANLGVLARAAVENGANKKLNPRNIPGILSVGPHYHGGADEVPFHTDADHPSVFWITNGWNDFQYNMASGAGACGMCYWLPPTMNSGKSRYEYWDDYAGEQKYKQVNISTDGHCKNVGQPIIVDDDSHAGIAPLKTFVGNSCSGAQNSFITVGNTAPCYGVTDPSNSAYPRMKPIANTLAPKFPEDPYCDQLFGTPADSYYPKVSENKGRTPTICPNGAGQDCSEVIPCAYSPDGSQEANCSVTSIDHYTTSFTWADTNIAAMWLRPQWYLVTNSAITDTQNGGLTFVSGGGYTGSDEIRGYWALAHKNVFIGNTQLTDSNPFAANAGPFNPKGLRCDPALNTKYCLNKDEGVVMPLSNFSVNQRLFSIYDGPSYQSANAYLDISKTTLTGCVPDADGVACQTSGWMYGRMPGALIDSKASSDKCYLPNAGIGWKQPNAFYYPPAFHSDKLYFNGVDIRHFVIEPLFKDGTYDTNADLVKDRYCINTTVFTGFTDIDRQTELSDDDGSLTGLLGLDNKSTPTPSISVNKDPFFKSPVETAECASDILTNMPQPWGTCGGDKESPICATANTSPYHYVTSVVLPCLESNGDCPAKCGATGDQPCWDVACENDHCYGVPLYRENKSPGESTAQSIRMAGQATNQRSTLSLDHAAYFMDTSVSFATQKKTADQVNVFGGDGTAHRYGVFLLYADPTTKQTYQFYVGSNFAPGSLLLDRVDQRAARPQFTQGTAIPCESGPGKCYDPGTGILTVTLDMSQISDFQQNYTDAAEEHCAPKSFCKFEKSCGCNKDQTVTSFAECDNACSQWATRDVNCPKGGCYGFEFTLPASFTASDQAKLPKFKCFNPDGTKPDGDDYWKTAFQKWKQNPGTQCDYNDKFPIADLCTDPPSGVAPETMQNTGEPGTRP